MTLKLERVREMCKLKKEIISYLFDYVSRKPADSWWKYKGDFRYDNQDYELECEVRMDNQVFTYRNLIIEHKQVVIDITDLDYEAELRKGMGGILK